jgi:hypothetical protein
MNRSDRRRAVRAARAQGRRSAGMHGAWTCPWCGAQEGLTLEICLEGCCDPQRACAACGVPVS